MLVHAAHPPAGPSEDSDGVSTPTLRPHLENLPPVAAEGLLPITPEGFSFRFHTILPNSACSTQIPSFLGHVGRGKQWAVHVSGPLAGEGLCKLGKEASSPCNIR